MKKILHIAPPSKFTEIAQWMFESVAPGQNRFIIISNFEVQSLSSRSTQFVSANDSESWKNISKSIKHYDLVVLHLLDRFKSKLVLENPTYPSFMWMLWGTEIYDEPYIYPFTVIEPRTRRFHRWSSFNCLIKNKMKTFRWFIYRNGIFKHPIKEALKCIKYIGNTRLEEFNMFKEFNILRDSVKMINVSYGPLSKLLDTSDLNFVNSNNILLGNSASPTNNHIEAIHKISEVYLGKQKIFAPLNYGHMDYGRNVGKEGRKKLGDNFYPLHERLSLTEYNKLLSSCSHIIFNHNRQQGFGNIISGLWYGSKIYLNRKNILFKYLTNAGFIIFDLKGISSIELEKGLSKSTQIFNREQLIQLYSTEVILGGLKAGLEEV